MQELRDVMGVSRGFNEYNYRIRLISTMREMKTFNVSVRTRTVSRVCFPRAEQELIELLCQRSREMKS